MSTGAWRSFAVLVFGLGFAVLSSPAAPASADAGVKLTRPPDAPDDVIVSGPQGRTDRFAYDRQGRRLDYGRNGTLPEAVLLGLVCLTRLPGAAVGVRQAHRSAARARRITWIVGAILGVVVALLTGLLGSILVFVSAIQPH